MRSALEIVAFSHGTPSEGITALLQVALEALHDEGMPAIAIHVDMALALLKMEAAEEEVRLSASKRAGDQKHFLH